MNRLVASILKSQLAGMPLIEKLAGLVQTHEYQETVFDENGENPRTVVKKIPVSCDMTVGTCDEKDLVPDNSKKGILYFEDNGVVSLGKEGQNFRYRSKLRMIVWFNSKWIDGNSCTEASAILINHVVASLSALNTASRQNLTRLQVSIDNIPRQGKALFAEYTYDAYNTGYLMAPYEYFGIDISVDFQMHHSCIDQLALVESLNECDA